MISPKEIESQLGEMTEADKVQLESMSKDLLNFSTSTIVNEELIKRLENMVNELFIIQRKYNWRLINLLKLGYRDA